MNTVRTRDFTALVGHAAWKARLDEVRSQIGATRAGRLVAQRYAAGLAYEKARQGLELSAAETALVALLTQVPALYDALRPGGRDRLLHRVRTAMTGEETLAPVLHLIRTASRHEAAGFTVSHSGFEQGTAFDLLVSREAASAEVVCDAISAEDGHAVQRGAWMQLVDRIDPDLQTWLAAHPGRYVLKMTLPAGLKRNAGDRLPELQARISAMLSQARRADYDEAAMLRLDPLLLAGAQADGAPNGVMAKLRREFGPEAHLAATTAGNSVFVMAARASTENDVALALRQRLAALAPARLSGERPGILAMFIDDIETLEWRGLREQHGLEREVRYFLTMPEAGPVVAVSCASRLELTGQFAGDMRFRNPSHPAAKSASLAAAVVSTV